jgi:CheY-like chemotaxis protein
MLILLVDDDPDEYEIFCEALRTFQVDVQCVHAANGIEAVHSLAASSILPDYIFLDSNMPVMDGKNCLKKIRADDRFKNIPVLVYTTSSSRKEMDAYKTLGANDFIVKPDSFSALINILRRFLAPGGA